MTEQEIKQKEEIAYSKGFEAATMKYDKLGLLLTEKTKEPEYKDHLDNTNQLYTEANMYEFALDYFEKFCKQYSKDKQISPVDADKFLSKNIIRFSPQLIQKENYRWIILQELLKFSDRYEITVQFWPSQTAVFICKDDVELIDFGGDFDFAIIEAIEYLNRINKNGN